MLDTVSAAFAFTQYKKPGFVCLSLLFFMNASSGSVTLFRQHRERETAEIYRVLDTDPFAE